MVKSALQKNSFREIFRSPGRYFAILGIILLGAGFFTGLRVTRDALVKTADTYLERTSFYDFQLISTLGYTEREVEAVRASGLAEAVDGMYTQDLLVALTEEDSAVHFMSLPSAVNMPEVTSGRLPEKSGEVLVDSFAASALALGDEIILSDQNSEEALDALAEKSFVVVGFCNSPLYLNYERGTTSVGSGSIAFFAYILPEDFTGDTYSMIYVRAGDLGFLYSDEYSDAADAAEPAMKTLAEEQAHLRYTRLISDNTKKLQDAEAQYADGLAEYEKAREEAFSALADAEKQLEDAEKELKDGRIKLEEGRKELETSKQDAQTQFEEAQAQLDDALKQLQNGEGEYADGLAAYQAGQAQYSAGLNQYNDSISRYSRIFELIDLYTDFQTASGKVQTTLSALLSSLAELGLSGDLSLEEQLAAAEKLWTKNRDSVYAALGTLADSADTLANRLEKDYGSSEALTAFRGRIKALRTLIANKDQMADAASSVRALMDAVKNLYSGASDLMKTYSSQADSARAQLAQAAAVLAQTRRQLEAAKAQVNAARAQLDEGWKAYFAGGEELKAAREEAENAFAEAEQQLLDSALQLDEGEAAFKDGVNELVAKRSAALHELFAAKRELIQAKAEIDDGWKALDELAEPGVFTLGRFANVGYACLDNDSMIVQNVAKVFPFFFFLVAALICITSMTRMVEEQRGQLGILQALGYSRAAVMSKYLFYAGSASLLGCGIGIPALSYIFPQLIWKAYRIMYHFADRLEYVLDWKLGLITTAGYILAILLVTFLSLAGQLRLVPAALLRPKAPKLGKRVLLERIPALWNHLSFMWKVTLRNIFRYHSRVLMMLLGVAGCTALMITGYGIRDSIQDVVKYQYSEITRYEYEVTFDEEPDAAAKEEFLRTAARYSGDAIFVSGFNASVRKNKTEKDLSLISVEDGAAFSRYFSMHNESGELPYPGKGMCAVNSALADEMDLSVGDALTLVLDEQEYSVTISGIFDNYIYNYVFISDETYETLTGKTPVRTEAYVLKREGASDATARLLSFPGVLNVSAGSVLKDRIGGIMDNLIYIVLLTIVCAAALAFIVIYNLININITERLREIATVKVLGFYRSEAAVYVLRENLLLTLLGALLGVPLGILLNRFVMSSIKVDLVSFIPRVKIPSFLFSIGFTLLFSFLVYLIMMRKLDKVDLAAALKAAE